MSTRNHFELCDNRPLYTRNRRTAPDHQKLIKDEIEKMLEECIISQASSSWSFLVVIYTNKDGNTRFCVDYHALNARMKAGPWPIPMIEDIFNDLVAAVLLHDRPVHGVLKGTHVRVVPLKYDVPNKIRNI